MLNHCLINAGLAQEFCEADDPLLCFLHTPRTGGSTFRGQVLDRVYGPEHVYAARHVSTYRHWPKVNSADLAGFKAYAGHSSYREIKLDRPYSFVTLLRDPVIRAISFYHYCARKEDHVLRELASTHSLEDFHEKGSLEAPQHFVNVQSKRVCGAMDADRAWETITTRFLGVGITEYLADFAAELGQHLHWPKVELDAVESRGTRELGSVSAAFREMIKQRDDQDTLLYARLCQAIDSGTAGSAS